MTFITNFFRSEEKKYSNAYQQEIFKEYYNIIHILKNVKQVLFTTGIMLHILVGEAFLKQVKN